MNLLIFYIVLAIGISFLCSILEAVMLSLTPNYLHSIKNKSPELYKKIWPLKANIEKPLASILTINTFAHTIGAAGAGAQALNVFGDEWIALFSFVLTLAILFLSEIIPKSIGAQYWKSLLGFAATVLPWMIKVTYPLVYISELISKLFGQKEEKTSREEIKAVVDIGLKDGALEESEYLFVKNSLEFKNKKAYEVMTKAEAVVGLYRNAPHLNLNDEILRINFTRIPIFGISMDDVKGYIIKSDVLAQISRSEKVDIDKLTKPMLIVPSDLSLKSLFFRLLERREHICSIIDEGGNFIGIVTLENILEELLGIEIIDEFDGRE